MDINGKILNLVLYLIVLISIFLNIMFIKIVSFTIIVYFSLDAASKIIKHLIWKHKIKSSNENKK